MSLKVRTPVPANGGYTCQLPIDQGKMLLFATGNSNLTVYLPPAYQLSNDQEIATQKTDNGSGQLIVVDPSSGANVTVAGISSQGGTVTWRSDGATWHKASVVY